MWISLFFFFYFFSFAQLLECVGFYLAKSEKFSAIISSSTFSAPLSLSSPLVLITWMLDLLLEAHRGLEALFLYFFFSLFLSGFSDWVVSVVLASSPLIISPSFLFCFWDHPLSFLFLLVFSFKSHVVLYNIFVCWDSFFFFLLRFLFSFKCACNCWNIFTRLL